MSERRALEEKARNRDYFVPADIAPALGADPHSIRIAARAGTLGFPVTVYGTRVKIPAETFMRYMGWRE